MSEWPPERRDDDRSDREPWSSPHATPSASGDRLFSSLVLGMGAIIVVALLVLGAQAFQLNAQLRQRKAAAATATVAATIPLETVVDAPTERPSTDTPVPTMTVPSSVPTSTPVSID